MEKSGVKWREIPRNNTKGAERMFLGEYQHSLDTKGRITVPARFREELGSSFIATKGLDNCIFLYPQDEWTQIESKVKSLPFTRADVRSFARFFFSGAAEMEIDKQGRILVPNNLRDYAGIQKDVIVIGVGSRVEIWSTGRWEHYNETAEASYESIAENLVDLGL